MQGSTSQPLAPRTAVGAVKTEKDLDLKRHRRWGEEIIGAILLFCGVVSIFTTLGIVGVLAGNTIEFFGSRAWVFARAPVAEAASLAALAQDITDGTTSFRIEYLADDLQFANQQFLRIGNETLRIVERNRNALIVTRGLDSTPASSHPAGTEIYPMTEKVAVPTLPITADATTIQLDNGFERIFHVGEEIRVGTEEMRITATDHAADTLTVERGINDTRLSEHDTSSQISQPDAVTFGEFITHTVWQPQTGEYGIWALLTATLLTSGVALIVAIPLGVGAAIYLSEYAKPQTRSTLKPILEVLAGIPTVVYGFFALTFVTPSLKNLLFGSSLNSLNMLAAGITIGVLITPMISSMCEDAISAVPRSLREASTGLGATKLETTVKVIIPAAISGISAAIIVAMSRAVGETMIVLLASGAGPNFTLDLRQSAETMAGHIARISTGDIEYGSLDYTSIFAVGTTLFIVTLGLNVISNQISRRLRERY